MFLSTGIKLRQAVSGCITLQPRSFTAGILKMVMVTVTLVVYISPHPAGLQWGKLTYMYG